LQPNGTPKRHIELNPPKKKQKKFWKVPIIILCILAPLVFWLGFSEHGFVHLYRTEMERQAYTERIRQLTEENQALLVEIDRLRTDKKYIESVARKQFNMIKPNEVIYRFEQEKKEDDTKDTADKKK
jgi:cell division protein FtsB